MKLKLSHLSVLVAFLVLPSISYSAIQWNSKSVGQLQSAAIGADCIYFTLIGVNEADPVMPGNPWFAMARTQYGAKDTYAMLLSAKLTGQLVSVVTTNTVVCGYAGVNLVWMP